MLGRRQYSYIERSADQDTHEVSEAVHKNLITLVHGKLVDKDYTDIAAKRMRTGYKSRIPKLPVVSQSGSLTVSCTAKC